MKVWHCYMSVLVVAAVLLLPGAVRGQDRAQFASYSGAGLVTQAVGDSRLCGPETMTQSTTPTELQLGSVSCPPSGTTRAASFARCFDVSAVSDPDGISINCVRFGVQQATVAVTLAVNIYEDTDGCPPNTASLQLLGTMNVSIPAGTALQMFTADFGALGGVFVPPGTDALVVEVAAPDLSGVGTFLIGANHNGQSAPSYIKAATCSLPDFVTLASVGYGSVHLAYSVDYFFGGEPPVGACCYPNGECGYGLQVECIAGGGTFQGVDTTCEMVSCPQPELGACCTPGGVCTIDDAWDCGLAGSSWLGADTVCGGDCDGDGASDACEIALGMAEDCNENGIPDDCDIASGYSCDGNGNGIPDECDSWMHGDLNCDGATNAFDIDPFVLALTDQAAYHEQYPCCSYMNADCNYDGLVNAFDIDPFVLILTGPPPAIRAVELAGNSLTVYPYFEYVRAFNVNAPIKLAMDPTRYPQIIGRTADVYVVEKKTPGEWATDPELVDVTVGGATTVNFVSGTIQANTFQIVGPNELNALVYQSATGAYTGFGHGYDMIVDLNRNGVLDGGDYIDGLGREAGLYVCHDSTQGGPLAHTELLYSVGTIFGIPATLPGEDIYYPSNIASMGQLPLLVVSHGNGHNYQWYDHIGNHMSSYGFIVMSHQNNTGPGSSQAALTTCGHTDAFLQLLPSIASGILVGHVDTSRIIWCGHSRGAEGVAKAYYDITHGVYTPTHYSAEDIMLVDSMLPIDTGGNPGEVNYHLWTASGDADVSGTAASDGVQTFHLHERATRYRASTVVQGTGHAWFHDADGDPVFDGPCPIYEAGVHLVQLGLMLPMYKHYVEGNVPGEDYMWRQYEHFHPPSVPVGSDPCYVVSHEYRNGNEDGIAFIDDYETQTGTGISSSGGTITYNVTNLTEGRLDDNNTSFSWTSSDPFNGATQDGASDQGKGVVFDWNGADKYYEWQVVPDLQDFSAWKYLGVRGAQGTQHPYTLATNGILTFTITLRDAAGHTSSISTGAYGGGFGMPYNRSGGWHNEMRRIRIRTTDFLTNGSPLDLSHIVAVRLDLGPSWGTAQGRIVIDEMMLDNDMPPFFVPFSMTLLTEPPEFLPPHVSTSFDVSISEGDDTLVADSALLYYRFDGGTWNSVALEQIAGDLWRGTLPAPQCGQTPEYYFSAAGDVTGTVTIPQGGASAPFSSLVGTYTAIFSDNFQSDLGWTVYSDPSVTSGTWQRAIPIGGDYGPAEDYDGSGRCYVTDNRSGYDVDGGPTQLTSPVLDFSAAQDPVIRFAEWMYCDDATGYPSQEDYLDVYLSSNGGTDWVLAAHIASHDDWALHDIHVADFVPLTATAQVRFSASDNPNNSQTEVGIDAVSVFDVECE